MTIFGIMLIILGLPLLIVYLIQEKKNKTWLRLGMIFLVIGILLLLFGS